MGPHSRTRMQQHCLCYSLPLYKYQQHTVVVRATFTEQVSQYFGWPGVQRSQVSFHSLHLFHDQALQYDRTVNSE